MDAAKEPYNPTPASTLLLSVGPVNHGNNKGKSIDLVETLFTVLVEPTYLQRISNATFINVDMKKFVELAQGSSPNFRIVQRGGVPLVVRRHDSREQIVLPSSGGFWIFALKECHGSSLAGHFSALKTL